MNDQKARFCPACRNNENTELGNKAGFRMLSCKNCSSIFSSYLPENEEAEDYDVYYTEENLKIPEFVIKRLDEIVGEFQPFFTHGRLLDVGFGAGTIMQVAKARGWDVHGTEVSKPAVEYARNLGFNVFHGELSAAEYPDNYFDVITASEVIEHCPQPEILLNDVFRLLRPGGLFWATTPSAKGLSYQLIGLDWTVICPPEHLQLFSKNGIALMLKKAGFSSHKIQTFGFNPHEVASNYKERFNKSEKKENGNFNRVGTSYQLNESLMKSPARQKVKNVINNSLNFFGIGDSLKIKAVK